MVQHSPTNSIRASHRLDDIHFVTVQYEPGTERVRSTCPDGQFWLMLNGGWRTRIVGHSINDCEPFSLSYHIPGEKNRRVVSPQGATLFGIQIPHHLLDSTRFVRPCPNEPFFMQQGHACLIATRIFGALTQKDTATALIVEELLPQLVLAVTGDETPLPKTKEQHWIRRAKEMLHEHRSDSLRLQDIASACNVHPIYLTAVFHQHFGCSIGEYLRRLRIETALTHLCKTENEIATIAREAGFYDQAHFNRVFKAHVGIAPGKLRRLAKER